MAWHRRYGAAGAPLLFALLAGCGGLAPAGGDDPASEQPSTTIAGSPRGEHEPAPAAREPAPGPLAPPVEAASTTGLVTKVVDGDTLQVDGQSVRLIGMDTPEVGECGYEEATAAMAALVGGRTVTLTAVPGRDDVDRYGRLLRYVEVDGTDAGLHEIELGFAVARYDGRDGYGTHPLQDAYVAADAAAPDVTCATPEPAPAAAEPVAPAPLLGAVGDTGCDPSYPTVCIPPSPPDLDCGDVEFRRFTVLPPDPHRFDANADGVGCENG